MSEARSEMQFREGAQDALEFLKDQGFTCVGATERRVRYESSKVYIDFGRLKTEERFNFTLFLRLVNPTLEKSLGDRMVDTPDTIAATANALAKALQSEGQGIIKGEDEVFERMKDVHWWDFDPEALGKSNESPP